MSKIGPNGDNSHIPSFQKNHPTGDSDKNKGKGKHSDNSRGDPSNKRGKADNHKHDPSNTKENPAEKHDPFKRKKDKPEGKNESHGPKDLKGLSNFNPKNWLKKHSPQNELKKAIKSAASDSLGDNKANSSEGHGNPIARQAQKLGKKALKSTNKVGTPALAATYGAAKFFDTMKNKMGLLLGQGGDALRGAFLNSPLAHMINGIHGAVQGASNLLHGAANAVGGMVHGSLNLAGSLVQGASHAVGTVMSGIGSGIASIAQGTGIGVAHAATIIGLVSFLGVGGAIVGVTVTFWNPGQRDSSQPESCQALVDAAQEGAGKTLNTNGTEDKEAQKIYSVLKTYGLKDSTIAGILGCWHRESHVDPTSVEGIFDEPYQIGPKKKAALGNLAAYTSKVSTGSSQYGSGSGACPGLGLGQWTGGNGLKLMAFAKKIHKHWYDLDTQLAYLLATPTPTGMPAKSFWNGIEHTNSVNAATAYFLTHWEGVSGNALGEREAAANDFKRKMSGWKIDSSYGNSILSLAKSLGASATQQAVSDAADACAEAQTESGDNSNLVNAALSYAWDNEKEAEGNNGTKLYQRVHDGIFPGDKYYMSCDRNVAMAARWSGTDVDYPIGPTSKQLQYLASSKKWKKIGSTDHFDYDKLKPGDVMIKDGHTYLYVGHKAVLASIKRGQHKLSKVPKGADDVDASYGERSGGIGVEARYSIIDHGDGPYDIYRCIKPDHSTKYKSIGARAK